MARLVSVALLLVSLLTPAQAVGQTPDGPGSSANTVKGMAAAVTAASIAVPLALSPSSCFGSGDYLQQCRLIFAGATVVGGGLGALVGRMIPGDARPDPLTPVLVGSALGAVGAFLVSLPACQQEETANPELLCGYDGMVEPGTVVAGAAIGGVLGYLFRGGAEGLEVRQLGPVRMPDGQRAWAAALTVRR